MAGEQVRMAHFATGIVGLGLLRHWLDAEATAARLAELRFLLDIVDDDELSPVAVPFRLDVEVGYTEWAATYDDPGNPLIEVEQPVLRDLIGTAGDGATAVDAACGTGRVSRLLVDAGYEVRGIDATAAMLERARACVPEASFEAGRLDELPFDDGLADLTTCCLAINHVADLDPVAAELARVTRVGGRVVVTDLHPIALLTGGTASYKGAAGRISHVETHLHLLGEQLAAFRSAGLVVEQCLEPLVDPVVGNIGPDALRSGISAALTGLPMAVVWSLRRT